MSSFGHSFSWAKGAFVLVVFALCAIALAAGGLGLAPVASLAGIGALVFAALDRIAARKLSIPEPGVIVLVGAALLTWAAVSLLWSQFDRPVNLLRTIAGGVLYPGFFLLCLGLQDPGRRLARAGVLLCVVATAAFFTFELATQGLFTASHRAPAPDPAQVWRNLGHGLSGWLMLLPGALLVLPWRSRSAAALGVVVALVGVACSVGFGLSSNALGLLAALAAGVAAWFWPRRTILTVGGLTALALFAAPALGQLAGAIPQSVRVVIPDSWELRLEAWSYAAARIVERPLIGWGFDASRTMTETIEYAGAQVQVLPLHPHNAGLHLWLETGLIGAALATVLVLLVARAVARSPGMTRPQAVAVAATAAAYAAMAQVSYGVWQEWWVAAIAWGAVAAALVGPAASAPSGKAT